ncbi:ENPP5 [Mytilus coruscus]|uniref:ENPP5 n=1 Tax=Mytilus coruscus TaxID=42192 RepID=A0A6J8D599_MYTCO|nr:ENPP5 [Mytilus coruscus]
MYDPVFNSNFSLRNHETRWWNGGEPLWVTARCQNRTSATYFWDGNDTGHAFGADSLQTKDKVKDMDEMLGYLLDKFDSHNLWNKVNLLVTSDHGMTTIDTTNKVVDIADRVDMSKIQFTVDNGPIMQVQPTLGQIDNVVRSLRNVSHISVLMKEEIPDYWHFKNNRRIMPVFLLAQEGGGLSQR